MGIKQLVAIHTPDNTGFPNYALMKISAWHKMNGDTVEWFDAVKNSGEPYDKIYSSKVFTFSDVDHYLPKSAFLGGTGYGLFNLLPDEVDAMYPDYSIYPNVDYAIGFMTRGCPNKCPWCIVPKKEGKIKPYRTWKQIKRPDSRDIVFMDNNILASQHGLQQIEELGSENVRVDFNQGLDARLITPEIGKMLGKIKWNPYIRLACDTVSQMPAVYDAYVNLRVGGVPKSRFFCYVLVKEDISDALLRVEFLRALNIDPFAQPYRDFENNIEPNDEQKDFARWVNDKAIFKTVKYSEYWGRKKGKTRKKDVFNLPGQKCFW